MLAFDRASFDPPSRLTAAFALVQLALDNALAPFLPPQV